MFKKLLNKIARELKELSPNDFLRGSKIRKGREVEKGDI